VYLNEFSPSWIFREVALSRNFMLRNIRETREEQGHAAQMMQDWLSQYKLDRKALAALAANLAAVEAYEEFAAQEVASLLEDLVDSVAEGGSPPSVQEATQTMLQAPATQQDDPGTPPPSPPPIPLPFTHSKFGLRGRRDVS